MSSIPLRRIPKQNQEPRPTAVRERRRSPWRWLPVWLRASGATLLVLSLTPLATLDEILTVSSFELLASRQPSATALRLRVDADALLHADCGTAIAARLREGGAFDWVALEPLESLCPVPGAVQVPRGAARRDMLGRVAGFRDAENSEVALLALGEWVSPLAAGALPTLDWHQLERGRVALELLRGRRVLLTPALEDSPENDQLERALAAAVTGEGARRPLPAWLLLPLAAVLSAAWARLVLSRGYRLGLLAAAALLVVLGAVTVCLARYGSFAVIPLASMGLAWLAGSAALVAPALTRRWRARLRADEWLERAALARERGLDQLNDAEFHSRIASLAEQSHPANLVLIAQLPARQWHLEFWNYGSAGEELIDERRRDIRRAPYCDDQGLPTIRVIHDYLVMKEMPVLVVPLQALGELEGYVFLCGDRAETAHRSDPSSAARLSVELALLMRRRRVARAALGEPEPDTPNAALSSSELASGAQIVGGEMDLLDAMSCDAPVGLMLADSFGHVRRLSREFASWLD
ncbi:MAG TPA: hypothetical protein VNN80_10695, partial [Polyangiaceae bacterium]|nr:hypothetical protein [Polyangiaceae bacterium]